MKSKKLQCEGCGSALYGEDLYNYDGKVLCRNCVVAKVCEGTVQCEYVGTCNDKTHISEERKEIEKLKKEIEELKNFENKKSFALFVALYNELEKDDPENVASRIDYLTKQDNGQLCDYYKELLNLRRIVNGGKDDR